VTKHETKNNNPVRVALLLVQRTGNSYGVHDIGSVRNPPVKTEGYSPVILTGFFSGLLVTNRE
jgi:hypothetical protein